MTYFDKLPPDVYRYVGSYLTYPEKKKLAYLRYENSPEKGIKT